MCLTKSFFSLLKFLLQVFDCDRALARGFCFVWDYIEFKFAFRLNGALCWFRLRCNRVLNWFCFRWDDTL